MWIVLATSVMLDCMFGIVVGQHGTTGEPACYSRFDYDHKILTSLVALETEQAKLQGIIKKQDEVIKALQTELIDIRSQTNQVIDDRIVSVGETGSTYVRWGRTICPGNGTELVYDGYVGGSHFTHTGGAANYLCLPKDPIWGYFQPGDQGGALVYGTEYEFSGNSQAHRERFFGRDVYENDVPCAVCRTKRSSTMMVPARNKCHDGWTLEYHGYLSAGHSTHKSATEFVCLDVEPEVIVGGYANVDGRLFYFAEPKCGPLRCPPYVQGRELTCTVCSK